jgi:two-component system OmpR family sensor kinase
VRPRSLRTRLVATALLLLAVASALIAGVTTIELRDYLIAQLDDDLRVSSTLIVRSGLPPAGGAGLPELGDLPRPPDSLVAVVRDGAVISAIVYPRAGGSQALSESAYAQLSGLVADGRPLSVDLGDLGEYRIMARAAAWQVSGRSP